MLIYPTLHYQNGGVKIDTNSETNVKNLFVAGEASGGLHGRNRLMGNSLLDLMVFGKRSGLTAASRAASMSHGKLTVQHLQRFRADAKKHGNVSGVTSPMMAAPLPNSWLRMITRACFAASGAMKARSLPSLATNSGSRPSMEQAAATVESTGRQFSRRVISTSD